MEKAPRTSFHLSPEARRLLDELAKAKGLSKTGVLEVIIRDAARQEGIK
jgi:predicted transcriptional regulator